MVETNIFRQPTAEEKRDMIIIGEKGYKDTFTKMNNAKQSEYLNKQRKPYCYRCAKLDFEDKIDNLLKEATRKKQSIKNFEIKEEELDKYADTKRFKLVKTTDAYENPRGSMTNFKVKVGTHEHYICNERQCGISIFKELEAKK